MISSKLLMLISLMSNSVNTGNQLLFVTIMQVLFYQSDYSMQNSNTTGIGIQPSKGSAAPAAIVLLMRLIDNPNITNNRQLYFKLTGQLETLAKFLPLVYSDNWNCCKSQICVWAYTYQCEKMLVWTHCFEFFLYEKHIFCTHFKLIISKFAWIYKICCLLSCLVTVFRNPVHEVLVIFNVSVLLILHWSSVIKLI